MTLLSIWILFADDLRLGACPKSADLYFFLSFLVCFAIFTAEIALTCYAKDKYLGSYFFYMDMISTVSILVSVEWISDYVFDTHSSVRGPTIKRQADRISVALRIAARASRIMRLMRVLKRLRVDKLLKAAALVKITKKREEAETTERGKLKQYIAKLEENRGSYKRQTTAQAKELHSTAPADDKKKDGLLERPTESPKKHFERAISDNKLSDDDIDQIIEDLVKYDFEMSLQEQEADEGEPKETNLGKHVTYNVMKILITIMLLIVLSIPLFIATTYSNEYKSQNAALDLLVT